MLIGNGQEYRNLKELRVELKIEEDVEFIGASPYKEMPKYYNIFDIFIALSFESESLGVSVLEALACEVPVIVSDVDGFKEIINDN